MAYFTCPQCGAENEIVNVSKCGECEYELPFGKGGHSALMEYLGLPQARKKKIR